MNWKKVRPVGTCSSKAYSLAGRQSLWAKKIGSLPPSGFGEPVVRTPALPAEQGLGLGAKPLAHGWASMVR